MKNLKRERPLGVILVFHCGGKYLTLRELKAKPENGKKAGMIGFLCETYEPDSDSSLAATAERGQREELGSVIVRASDIKFSRELEFEHVIVKVAIIEVEHMFRATPQSDDIKHNGWLSMSQMETLPLRPEMDAVLKLLPVPVEA